jgi:hypothetical protein
MNLILEHRDAVVKWQNAWLKRFCSFDPHEFKNMHYNSDPEVDKALSAAIIECEALEDELYKLLDINPETELYRDEKETY